MCQQLCHGLEAYLQRNKLQKALHAAASRGYESIVHLLLVEQTLTLRGLYCGNALKAAYFYGRQSIVRLLLDNRAYVNQY